MTDGGVDRSIECTGNVDVMMSAFECVHDVCVLVFFLREIHEIICIFIQTRDSLAFCNFGLSIQGWGVAVLCGVPSKDAVFMTKPINLLNERTLKGTFFGNYKPKSDLPAVVEMYMNQVN